jgi:hypothetical protein
MMASYRTASRSETLTCAPGPTGREGTILRAGSVEGSVGFPRRGDQQKQRQTKCQRPRISPDLA